MTYIGPVWYSFMSSFTSSFTTSIAKQPTLCPTLWSASLKTHSHIVKHMVKLQKHGSLPCSWSCSWSCFLKKQLYRWSWAVPNGPIARFYVFDIQSPCRVDMSSLRRIYARGLVNPTYHTNNPPPHTHTNPTTPLQTLLKWNKNSKKLKLVYLYSDWSLLY
jgi:hypothetical protein